MAGEPSEDVTKGGFDRYMSDTDMDSRVETPANFTTDFDGDEEFESVSQVTGPVSIYFIVDGCFNSYIILFLRENQYGRTMKKKVLDKAKRCSKQRCPIKENRCIRTMR